MENKGGWVIDLDIRKFFDTLDWGETYGESTMAQRMWRRSDTHNSSIKWLKAGVMENGEVTYSDEERRREE